MGKSTEPLELDPLPSGLASIAYYTGSPTCLHIGLSWGKFKSSIYAGSHPRDSDVIAVEWPGHLSGLFKVLKWSYQVEMHWLRGHEELLNGSGSQVSLYVRLASNTSPVVGVPTLFRPQCTCTTLPLPSTTTNHHHQPHPNNFPRESGLSLCPWGNTFWTPGSVSAGHGPCSNVHLCLHHSSLT